MKLLLSLFVSVTILTSISFGLTIGQINGPRYLSPYAGQNVTGIRGIVTAKGPSGFFLRSVEEDLRSDASNSIYVFGSTFLRNITVGNLIALDATVAEYRSSTAYIYLTELTNARNLKILSSLNPVVPIAIGQNFATYPPAQQFSGFDNGDVLSIPNNSSQISVKNPVLDPTQYGLDFWESLSGELVSIQGLTAISKPNSFGDTWITGSWNVTGRNGRGGMTMTDRDSNPEAILIGAPLDGSDNPADIRLGDSLEDITGVVTQAFGFYRILPLTSLAVAGTKIPASVAPTTLLSNGTSCNQLSMGAYNVENLTPTSTILPSIAKHIVEYLKAPTIMFLQEIQDDNGAVNDGVVSANLTLTTLVNSIKAQSNITYAYATVNPVSNSDGGEPGGNIRVAYLYQPSRIRLHNANPGSSTDANAVSLGSDGIPELKYNPGRIDPLSAAWSASRKPLAAAWETLDGRNVFYTVNVHFGSKGGGSSIHGDLRTPVNGGVANRLMQANVTADFISQILALSPSAKIITAGDFNEFSFAPPLISFVSLSGLQELDEVAKTPVEERYTYLYDMNCQQLDHIFVSPSLAARPVGLEHIHVNTWASVQDQISDHDPSVALLDVCE
ncbi:DNase I-like protein [Coleophoma cylindrospora]|uniref:DNase I-like protein n=1 Tax=Coleophoma cylindrospora TaxID=1849047 RepID=A0A3D8QKJ0_9HELO|nr:DNase I-like protein [Coleophoma cylindrospora]